MSRCATAAAAPRHRCPLPPARRPGLPPPGRHAGAALAATAVLLLTALLGGCGVPAQPSASVARADDVPFGLLDPAPDTSSPLPGTTGTAVAVYLVSEDSPELVGVARLASSGALSSRLRALADGPDQAERAAGLRSAVAGPDVVASVHLAGGVATVDLAEEFTELSGGDQLLAIAQMVFTLTERADVARVAFTLDADAIPVPQGDGSLTSDPVARDAYTDLIT